MIKLGMDIVRWLLFVSLSIAARLKNFSSSSSSHLESPMLARYQRQVIRNWKFHAMFNIAALPTSKIIKKSATRALAIKATVIESRSAHVSPGTGGAALFWGVLSGFRKWLMKFCSRVWLNWIAEPRQLSRGTIESEIHERRKKKSARKTRRLRCRVERVFSFFLPKRDSQHRLNHPLSPPIKQQQITAAARDSRKIESSSAASLESLSMRVGNHHYRSGLAPLMMHRRRFEVAQLSSFSTLFANFIFLQKQPFAKSSAFEKARRGVV